MHPVLQVSSGEFEAATGRPFSQIAVLPRRYRSRQRCRPASSACRTGDLAVKLDGFLAVFPRNVTLRTTPPGAASYVSVNQQLTGY
jgi:hypothetical protein